MSLKQFTLTVINECFLMYAKKCSKQKMDKFIELGAEINYEDKETGMTALMYASKNGHIGCLERLIEAGANFNQKDFDEYTPLMYASHEGNLECLKKLIEAGAKINKGGGGYGCTALMLASKYRKKKCMIELIERGAEIDKQDEDGFTALMYASRKGNKGGVKLLIESGAKIDMTDEFGTTALITASERGHICCIRELIGAGANMEINSDFGQNALGIAIRHGKKECAMELIRSGKDMDNLSKGWALYHARKMTDRMFLEYFLLMMKGDKSILHKYTKIKEKTNLHHKHEEELDTLIMNWYKAMGGVNYIVSLKLMCLRVIETNKTVIDIPKEFPSVILNFPLVEKELEKCRRMGEDSRKRSLL